MIVELREAVGWGGMAADYPAALAGYWATVGGFDTGGGLVAWCAILSDGVRHAVLLDVLVHPRRQHQGIGRALVAQALAHIHAHGITITHVDFLPERAAFYERCGFRIGLGGIYEAR
jgi:GNAT superfamily N-acetyltransferase